MSNSRSLFLVAVGAGVVAAVIVLALDLILAKTNTTRLWKEVDDVLRPHSPGPAPARPVEPPPVYGNPGPAAAGGDEPAAAPPRGHLPHDGNGGGSEPGRVGNDIFGPPSP